ncbi:MAG: NUDIX domain-containing protein [Balneolaceae bacterium]|nr:NUDIX domain-containing protein [Balneolaceae bacterium]
MHNNEHYKDRIRPRICGLLMENDAILLVEIHSSVSDRLIWMPPGGELEFGESIEECLVREFEEETGLQVAVQSFQFINELIEPPFHALELYYRVEKIGGNPKLGNDPEFEDNHQLLKDLQWISIDDLDKYKVVPNHLVRYLKP